MSRILSPHEKRLRGIRHLLLGLTEAISGVLIVCSTVLVTLDVVMRYFFNRPILWAVDITGYMLFMIVILPVAAIHRVDRHVSVDILIRLMNERLRRALAVLSSAVAAVFVLIVVAISISAAGDALRFRSVMSGVVPAPRAAFFFVIAFSHVLLALELVLRAVGVGALQRDTKSSETTNIG